MFANEGYVSGGFGAPYRTLHGPSSNATAPIVRNQQRRAASGREAFQGPPFAFLRARPDSMHCKERYTMNRFDREYWDGVREMAPMFYDSIRGRSGVPDDLKNLPETTLRETGERKNRDLRDAIGIAVPSTGSSRQPNGH